MTITYGILKMVRSTKLPAIVTAALSRARYETGSGGYMALATSSADVSQRLLDLANRCQNRMADDFPFLNVATQSTLTLTVGTRYVALPATLRHCDILALEWTSATDIPHQEVRIITQAEAMMLDSDYRDDDFTTHYPQFAVLDVVNHRLYFYRCPSAEETLTITFREAVTPFVAADLVVATATVLCAVPDDMIEGMELLLAADLRWMKFGSRDEDRGQLLGEYGAFKDKWIHKIHRPVAAERNAQMQSGGYPVAYSNMVSGGNY